MDLTSASMGTGWPPVTPLARPVLLDPSLAVDDEQTADRLHELYRAALGRFPPGPLVSRGLPFVPPGEGTRRRWVPLDSPVRIDLGGVRASHLVLLWFCDAWHDVEDRRPPGTPPGWVIPVGEPLARIVVRGADGTASETVVRRRFEVNEGIIGWGSMAFLAVPHLVEEVVDWRGPHPRQSAGRLAPPGQSGPLTVLPGSWGADQTGVTDNVPSATDDLMLWLHAMDVAGPNGSARELTAVELSPFDGSGHGRLVVLAAVTAYAGSRSPLRWLPRQALRLQGAADRSVSVDLGLVARRMPLADAAPRAGPSGWGAPVRAGPAEVVELTAAVDAVLYVGEERITAKDLNGGTGRRPTGRARVEALRPADRRLDVAIVAADGQPTAARVRVLARDGRYLPPLGHRVEVNPALYEDLGADVVLEGAVFAYVPGSFAVEVPADGATIEVVAGMDVAPVRTDVSADDAAAGDVRVRLGEPLSPVGSGWVSGDTHVHFLAPSTALLQARAERVNVVHLLATQWGDHHTSTTDLGADIISADGRHAVWIGSENRQNMLGHIGVVGTARPLLPLASGGPPEGAIGAPVTHLMADWLRECREQGGLAVAAHFPLPMAEVAADIAAGLLDALELQCFDPTLQSPPIAEWYHYLNAGYRLPLVGGTDKMTASVPLGQVRTWAHLEDDEPLSFEAWARAVKAGRTCVSSGPLLELRVDGHEPGSSVAIDGRATLDVVLTARAAQAIITAVEVVLDGVVVAAVTSERPTTELVLSEAIAVERGGWIAGRSRSPFTVWSAFATTMAAHTSAVYLEHAGAPRRPPNLAVPLALVDGTRAWLEHLAPVRDAAALRRFTEFLDDAERRLRERSS